MQTTLLRRAGITLGLVAAVGLGLTSFSARAEDAKPSQQQRMKDCNAEAKKKDMKGDERKGFMSSCLKGQSAAAAPAPKATPQQQRMKDCNVQAKTKNLKGDERKGFMSSCLKG